MENSSLDLKVINFAAEIDANELLDKIQKFRNLNKQKLSDIELRNEIYDVISFNNISQINTSSLVFKNGSHMFRIRKLNSKAVPNQEIQSISDVWSPPAKFVNKIGRLNKKNESLLYVCPAISTAIEETKVNETDTFALIIYDVIDDIKGNCIGINQNYENFPSEHRLKMRLVHDFLKEEFSRDVGNGTEHLYKVSEMIAKDFFDLPPRIVQDAWVYPSIADKPEVNLCFRPDIASEKLFFRGVLIISGYEREGEIFHFNVNAVAKNNYDGSLGYHTVESDEGKAVIDGVFR